MIVTVEEAAEKLATSLHSKIGDSDYDLLQLGASGLELEERIEKAILTGMVRPRSGLTGAYDDSQAFLGKRALVQFEDVIIFLQGEGMNAPTASKRADAGATGNWQDDARAIADECFDADTKGNCRDSMAGYARRVMDIMQQRNIHGPRGLINNSKTIEREALQGSKWWQHKKK